VTEPAAADDAKLVTLARAARARVGAAEGAAIRDLDGRTYAAASVVLPSLSLSALEAAVAAAVSSGALGLEAAAVVTEETGEPAGLAAARDLGGPNINVLVAGINGVVHRTLGTPPPMSASGGLSTSPDR
jgi:hypothetical protein